MVNSTDGHAKLNNVYSSDTNYSAQLTSVPDLQLTSDVGQGSAAYVDNNNQLSSSYDLVETAKGRATTEELVNQHLNALSDARSMLSTPFRTSYWRSEMSDLVDNYIDTTKKLLLEGNATDEYILRSLVDSYFRDTLADNSAARSLYGELTSDQAKHELTEDEIALRANYDMRNNIVKGVLSILGSRVK